MRSLVGVLAILAASRLCGQTEWPSYGHDLGSTRYSPVAQINTANVSKLVRVWTFHQNPDALATPAVVTSTARVNVEMPHTVDGPSGIAPAATPTRTRRWRHFSRGQGRVSAATPLVVNGVMYLPTILNKVVALDPLTGKQLWEFIPPGGGAPARRGVAYWPGEKGASPEILFGTSDGHLIALDAASGKPARTFGDEGMVNMKVGIDNGYPDAFYGNSSPPLIYKNLVITGAETQETPYLGMAGDTRAWDARTGKLVWRFHSVARPGEVGGDTWTGDSWKARSGTNVWGLMSLDASLGLLYMPFGSASDDFWGGDRPGKDLFATSIVAVDALTGKLKWYFQTVHHDLWDFDVVPAPVLMSVEQNGETIPAVTQFTKAGYAFILDRRNGKPIYGATETKVPSSDVPEEQSWPTQPIPTKPPPLARTSFSPEEISKVTPEHERACRDKLEAEGGVRYGGPFTPFGYNKLTIVFPGNNGGVNWSGASYDPKLGYMFVNPIELGAYGKIVRGPEDSPMKYIRTSPFGGQYDTFTDKDKGWPCQQPPWSKLIAIDANTGEFAWSVPLGTVPELEAMGIHNTGAALSWGGSIATAGGLVFIASTSDDMFRAFESKTGKVLWETKLPAGGYATPITYLGKDGKQYIALQATGGRMPGAPTADTLVAYALP